MTRGGASLDSLEGGAERGYLPHALAATALVVVAPALALLPLAPFDGVLDVLLATLLATGASVALASAGSALWTRTRWSRELAFGDLMLWEWALRRRRRRRLEDDLARVARAAGSDGDGARRLGALRRMAVVLEARDERSHGHSDRVARHAARIADRIGLGPDEIARLRVAAAVHDVGKTRVARSQLDAPPGDPAAAGEQRTRHALAGAELVAAAGAPDVAEIVRHQGARFDAAGASNSASVSRAARVLAVADAFDTLAEGDGVARSRANALDELAERAGRELDPEVVAAFVDYYSARRSVAAAAVFATAPLRAARWLVAAPTGLGASVPPLTQGACVAGALAIAGTCLPLPGLERGTPGGAAAGPRAQEVQPGAGSTARDGNGEREAVGGRRDVLDRPALGGSGPQPVGDPGSGGAPQPPGSTEPGSAGGRELAGASPPAGGPAGGSSGAPGLPSAPDLPGQGGSSSGPVEQLQLPDLPLDTGEVVDPVVDEVERVLAPLPVERVTDPVQDLLGRVGGDGGGLLR